VTVLRATQLYTQLATRAWHTAQSTLTAARVQPHPHRPKEQYTWTHGPWPRAMPLFRHAKVHESRRTRTTRSVLRRYGTVTVPLLPYNSLSLADNHIRLWPCLDAVATVNTVATFVS
jgi:hypothetical protein